MSEVPTLQPVSNEHIDLQTLSVLDVKAQGCSSSTSLF